MVTVTRDQWLAQLRSYKGVRFQHQGRSRAGLDCIGLLAVAGRDLGITDKAALINGYERTPDSTLFETRAADFLTPLPYNRLQPLTSQVRPGDVMIFWIDREGLPRHIAVYTGTDKHGRPHMIHSYAKAQRNVIEMPMSIPYWAHRVNSLWTLPNFED